MAQFKLYIDTDSGEAVRGTANPTAATLPRFFQGDTITFRIYLLERTSSYPGSNPFAVINNADLSLRVGIGPKNGSAGSTLLTSQFTWSKDAANSYFYADLPLNTAAINSAIGTAESTTAYFEVEYTSGGLPTTVFQKQITIEAEVLEAASVTVPAGETAISAETANATFLQRINDGFYLRNAAGALVFVYLGDDNAVHMDPVTA